MDITLFKTCCIVSAHVDHVFVVCSLCCCTSINTILPLNLQNFHTPQNHPLPCSLGSPSTYALQCYLTLLCLLHLHLQLVPLLQSNHLHLGDKFHC